MAIKLVQCTIDIVCLLFAIRMATAMDSITPQVLSLASSCSTIITNERMFWEMSDDPCIVAVRMTLLDSLNEPVAPRVLPVVSFFIRLIIDQRTFWEMRENPHRFFCQSIFWSLLYLISRPLAIGMEMFSAQYLSDDFTPILRLGFWTLHSIDLMFFGLALHSAYYWRILEPQMFYGPRRLHIQYTDDTLAEYVNHGDGPLEKLYRQQINENLQESKGSIVENSNLKADERTSQSPKPRVSESSKVPIGSGDPVLPTIDSPSEKDHKVSSSQSQTFTQPARFHPLLSVGGSDAFIYWCMLNIVATIAIFSLALFNANNITSYDQDYSW